MKIAVKRNIVLAAAVIMYLSGVAAGCVYTPPKPLAGYSFSVADRAADTALTMTGRPYKYRGTTPSGFDCSGLVYYSYAAAGMRVPHSTKELKRYTRPVMHGDMRKGDLVFFHERGGWYSHVGIYVGDWQFIHAPSTGKTVRIDSLLDPYWKKHFLDARRFL